MTNAEMITALRYCVVHPFRPCNGCVLFETDGCINVLHGAAADALEAADRLLDQNTQRCEALRKQLRESHESYEQRIAELEADKKTLINVVKDKSDFHATKDAMRIAELESQIPKEGEWITKDHWYYCSNCGHEMFFTGTFDEEQRYCYFCGAKMKGENDGSH